MIQNKTKNKKDKKEKTLPVYVMIKFVSLYRKHVSKRKRKKYENVKMKRMKDT